MELNEENQNWPEIGCIEGSKKFYIEGNRLRKVQVTIKYGKGNYPKLDFRSIYDSFFFSCNTENIFFAFCNNLYQNEQN